MKNRHQLLKYGADQLLDEKNAAEFLGVSAQWLRCSRMANPSWAGPPYVLIGKRAIRYRFGTLVDFVAARVIDPADRLAAAS